MQVQNGEVLENAQIQIICHVCLVTPCISGLVPLSTRSEESSLLLWLNAQSGVSIKKKKFILIKGLEPYEG